MSRTPVRTSVRGAITRSVHTDATNFLITTLDHLSKRSDTSFVLTSATALEPLLEQAILANMRPLSKTLYSELFSGYGPLATFSGKIDIAYALRIVDDDLVGDLRAIKAIRNAFAHPDEVVHFESPELTRHFQKLTGWHKSCEVDHLFHERVVACANSLNQHVDAQTFVKALQRHAAERNRPHEKPSPEKS